MVTKTFSRKFQHRKVFMKIFVAGVSLYGFKLNLNHDRKWWSRPRGSFARSRGFWQAARKGSLWLRPHKEPLRAACQKNPSDLAKRPRWRLARTLATAKRTSSIEILFVKIFHQTFRCTPLTSMMERLFRWIRSDIAPTFSSRCSSKASAGPMP